MLLEEDFDLAELRMFNEADIPSKLIIIGLVRSSVELLFGDYIWNEGYCIRNEVIGLPQGRVYKFDAICDALKVKSVGEILDIVSDYPEMGIGTNENREYLLKKFELWTGE